jgi:hypothetical protein
MRRRRGRLSRGSEMRGEMLFQELKSLKELDIELETSEDKVADLMAIVEKAKTWKCPLKNGMVLSTEGLQTKTTKYLAKTAMLLEQYLPALQWARTIHVSPRKRAARRDNA